MKIFYLSIPIIFLFIIGCSHTYEVSKYYSKSDLYNEFNGSAQNQELKVTLTNDSSFVVSNGARIKNDSMLFNNKMFLNYNSQLPIAEVKQASYNNHLKGIIPGFLIGTISGGIIGATGLLGKPKDGGNHPQWNQFESTIGGAILGLIVGSVVGTIEGFNYYFEFNP